MFITFEGPEGGGKTSQILALAQHLRTQKFEVVTTREPGGTEIGDKIRQILLNPANAAMIPRTEILLFLASRAQLVEELIRPHLLQNRLVICDRFTDSTLAYQGYGRGVDLAQLRALNALATGGLEPDLTLLLDVDVEKGLRRRASDGGWNRLDANTLAFHRRVREGYAQLAAAHPQRWAHIDASRPWALVRDAVFEAVAQRLPQKAIPEF